MVSINQTSPNSRKPDQLNELLLKSSTNCYLTSINLSYFTIMKSAAKSLKSDDCNCLSMIHSHKQHECALYYDIHHILQRIDWFMESTCLTNITSQFSPYHLHNLQTPSKIPLIADPCGCETQSTYNSNQIDSQAIQIFIKLGNRPIVVSIDPHSIVNSLKHLIHTIEGIPPHHQFLMSCCHSLRDNDRLIDCMQCNK